MLRVFSAEWVKNNIPSSYQNYHRVCSTCEICEKIFGTSNYGKNDWFMWLWMKFLRQKIWKEFVLSDNFVCN